MVAVVVWVGVVVAVAISARRGAKLVVWVWVVVVVAVAVGVGVAVGVKGRRMTKGRPRGSVSAYTEPKRPLHPIVYELRKRRIEAKITQGDLSERAGWSLVTIEDWEQGRTLPGLQSLADWAASLGAKLAILDEDTMGQ